MAAGMQRVVQVHAGEHREDISLQERDKQLERSERDHHAERQCSSDCDDNAEADGQQRDETREDLQGDVARQHRGRCRLCAG